MKAKDKLKAKVVVIVGEGLNELHEQQKEIGCFGMVWKLLSFLTWVFLWGVMLYGVFLHTSSC